MTICLSEKECQNNNLGIDEVLAVLLIKVSSDIPKLFESLEEKEIIVKDIFNNYTVTQRWDDVVSTILLDSDKNPQSKDRLESLAIKLAEIFPSGKKEGTPYYYKGNKKDNILRLKKFFKLYGNKYTDEQILNAARAYVMSFNGNYQYMRILKYFIWKDERKRDSDGNGYIEETSDLANYIENAGQEENLRNDWTSTLK